MHSNTHTLFHTHFQRDQKIFRNSWTHTSWTDETTDPPSRCCLRRRKEEPSGAQEDVMLNGKVTQTMLATTTIGGHQVVVKVEVAAEGTIAIVTMVEDRGSKDEMFAEMCHRRRGIVAVMTAIDQSLRSEHLSHVQPSRDLDGRRHLRMTMKRTVQLAQAFHHLLGKVLGTRSP